MIFHISPRCIISYCLLILLLPINGEAAAGALKKRAEPLKPEHTRVNKHQDKTRILIKFKDGLQLRLRANGLSAQDGTNLSALQTVLNKIPVTRIERVFDRPESILTREHGVAQHVLGEEIADPNLFFEVRLATSVSDVDVAALVDTLNSLAIVEMASIQNTLILPRADIPPTTPNYTVKQSYLGDAPNGLNWIKANASGTAYPGMSGANVTVVDLEFNWNTAHEDLKDPEFIDGTPDGDRAHGTAVLGILLGQKNDFGITGIVPDAPYGLVAVSGTRSIAASIDAARSHLKEGDVLLLELSVIDGQENIMPLEIDASVFTAIQLATAAGIIVIEPAGNGQRTTGNGVNLDSNPYAGLFNRNLRDSGAILVAAAEMGGLSHRYAAFYSNYGSRIDSYAWGNAVTTTGYGSLFNDAANQDYTTEFAGTSAAAPMVAGCVTAIQSYYKQLTGLVLKPWEMRALLTTTGTSPSQQAHYIGSMPNLLDALNLVKNNAAKIIDSDHDGLFDADELALGTNPNLMDTDGDGLADSDELRFTLSDPKTALSSLITPRPNGYNTLTTDQFQWTQVPGADFYQVFLLDLASNAALINQVTDQSNCSAGLCSFTSTATLTDGRQYMLWIYTFPSESVAGGWSSPTLFTSWTRAPLNTNLQAPVNATTNWKPKFTWGAQPGAIGYNLVVEDPTLTNFKTEAFTLITPSEAGCASGQSTCSYTWTKFNNSLSTGLLAGTHYWWIRPQNPLGTASSTSLGTLNVALTAPNAVTPISPINNAVVTNLPVLNWKATPMATYYWINVVDGKGVDYGYMLIGADQSNCANEEASCSWTPTGFGTANLPLPVGGTSKWRVAAANSAVSSVWSAWASFTVR